MNADIISHKTLLKTF